jgi:hypothetical protein
MIFVNTLLFGSATLVVMITIAAVVRSTMGYALGNHRAQQQKNASGGDAFLFSTSLKVRVGVQAAERGKSLPKSPPQ